ncbi:MAG TPA: Ku protein [Flavipsychrobacter sp.]|nr:Ku protein [Flavipsychrobacter sp.]
MRSIWSGAIGFGLVNIPMKLYSATESAKLDLDMLDKKDHAKIKYNRMNADSGKEVAWGDIVKGYKYEDDYVILTDEDFEKASPEKSKTIAIEEFTEAAMIDPAFYDTPYYIEPAKGGERAYALLREALKDTGKVAVGRFVMRSRENLCIVRPQDNMLVLMKLRFAEEIRDTKELNLPSSKVDIKPAELKMAEALIDQLTPKKFDIAKYKDTYDQALLKLIEAKAKGKKIAAPKPKAAKTKTVDLMEQLKASLAHKKAS